MKVVFGTRGSDLALTQTKSTMARFNACNPDIETAYTIIKTTGDTLTQAPLSEIGGFGAFTREIETALLSGDIDIAVHSFKDLPIQQPEGLYVAAIPERQTPADALISNAGYTLETLPENARVGTSSLRRRTQLLLSRPDLRIEELRGNVPTRLSKVRDGQYDAVIIALAGLTRLGLHREPGLWEIPVTTILPAPGQGALALEIRQADTELARRLTQLHDERASVEARCERAVLQGFGGGCRSPLGAYAHCEGDTLRLDALATDPGTGKHFRLEHECHVSEALNVGLETGKELRAALGF